MPITNFLHVSLCISDPGKSVPFYRDVLGFEVINEQRYSGPGPSTVMDVGDSEFTVWLLTNGGYRLELIHYERPKSPPLAAPPRVNMLGLSHLTVGVVDPERTLQELKDRGVVVREHTRGNFPEATSGFMFLFEDPDGFLIETYTVPEDGNLPVYGGSA
jgi:catechol 2,3-dioxygenase-like lactoylglutathione lyase family enzyme